MLEDFVKARRPEDEELAAGIKAAREALNACQMKIKEAGLPVMVIFEGWGAAGKGSVLGRVIKSIDPRFFKVQTYAAPTAEEKRYPFLYRYIRDIPEKGKFTFYDTYWMEEITDARLDGSMSDAEYEERIDSINRTERTLVDNGYLVMKFFFQIGKKEQKRRLDELLDNKDTKWRVDKSDLYENKHYDESIKVYDKYLKDTNSPTAPWYIIDAKDKKFAELQVLEFLNSGIDTALKNKDLAVPILQNTFALKKTPKLKDIELKGKTLTDEEYDKRLDELQDELRQLHYKLYRKKIPVIIAYEGWDAAGKGGNIKRITGALDPRGFEVLPIASPEPHEKARHFLWRFWTRLPKTGHIAIFDRTWYGRVMVERI
ncbi:MAG: phosphate--AMP phosphotransferase, partial [Clostridiales bacterium]|nr:phosphate--AMP phosphotransferase [Clostridiales bacterium]